MKLFVTVWLDENKKVHLRHAKRLTSVDEAFRSLDLKADGFR
jgi:hypothetical protein